MNSKAFAKELFESIETSIVADSSQLFAEYAKEHPNNHIRLPPLVGLSLGVRQEHKVRLIGFPMQYWLTMGPHYRPDKPDVNKWSKYTLPLPEGYKLYPSEGTAFSEHHVALRFKILAFDRKDNNQIKILDFPERAFEAMLHAIDKFGHFTGSKDGYDLEILINPDANIAIRTNGKNTPFTKMEVATIGNHPFYGSLEGLCSQHTPEEIAAIKAGAHVTHPPNPKAELDRITELLYDLSKTPNDHSLAGIRNGLLVRYKAITGKDKPGFFV